MNPNNDLTDFFTSIKKLKINILNQDSFKFIKNIENRLYTCDFAEVYIHTYNKDKYNVFDFFEVDSKNILNQIEFISKVDCPYIPKFAGIVEDKSILFVFYHVEGSLLEKIDLKTLTDEDKMFIAKDIANAIEYINSFNCVHRNISPENIIYDQKNKKAYLINFFLSKIIADGISVKTRKKGGDIYYTAPEVFDSDTYDDDGNLISYITHKTDVWSYGCLLSYIYSGFEPWTDKIKCVIKIQKYISSGKKFPIPDNIKNKEIRNIISKATISEKTTRYEISEIIKELNKLDD